jgi:hypothetical protein
MRLQFLGKDPSSGDDGCPALYATDRGTYVVQGKKITDPDALADLQNVLDDETFVEIPRSLLQFAEEN